MTDFPTNPASSEPYAHFRFRVAWDTGGKVEYVAGFSHVGGLSKTTEVISHRQGGETPAERIIPGQSSFAAITMERGLTLDVAFVEWANRVWDYPDTDHASEGPVSLKDFRKDLILDIYNEAGQRVLRYRIYRAWPSEFTALPELDANADNAVAIETLVLQNEGWERDTSIGEPSEPSFHIPGG